MPVLVVVFDLTNFQKALGLAFISIAIPLSNLRLVYLTDLGILFLIGQYFR